VAVKRLFEGHDDSAGRKRERRIKFEKEIALHQKLHNHPCIPRLFGLAEWKGDACAVMDLVAAGSLESVVFGKNVSLGGKLEMPKSAAAGVAYAHKNGVVHRDIACRNFLHSGDRVYVCDFGLALELPAGKDFDMAPPGPAPIKWMAPEAVLLNHYSRMADVWMFGVFLWELLAEQEPFAGTTSEEVRVLVRREGKLLPEALPGLPDGLTQLLKDCWQLDERLRPTMEKVHDFIDYFLHQTLPTLPSPVPSLFVAGAGGPSSKSQYAGGPAAAGDKKHYYLLYPKPDDSV